MKQLNKKDVIKHLEDIALYLELKGENPFRISAYRKAAQNIEFDQRSLSEIDDFSEIKGIGKGTNTIIRSFLETGESEVLNKLKEEVPVGLISLLKIPGLGGKRIASLYEELDVVDLESLKNVCESGALEKVKGFGKKTSENILKEIEAMNKQADRLPIATVLPLINELNDYLSKLKEIEDFEVAGSARRFEETVKDIDYMIATEDSETVTAYLLAYPKIKDVIASGQTKTSVKLDYLDYLINVDFRLVTKGEYATSLHHFTGSKEHNVKMRQLAKSRNEKISEYGVEDLATGELHQFKNEKEFFNHFDLEFIPAEVRQGKDELELFQAQSAVNYLEITDIRGDLHMHTSWSDGANSIEEMIQQGIRQGYDYIAITDHSKYLKVANGLTETDLKKQLEEIKLLGEKYPEIKILYGVEMDILPNGELDFDDLFLKDLDIVIAAIHSGFNQSEKEIMARLKAALNNPYVDIIAHPTGRLIGRRTPYQVDMKQLIKEAAHTNTVLEINAAPVRLDLSAEWAAQAEAAGVNIAINTDAHRIERLDDMKYGVSVAKAALLQKETVINSWKLDKLLAYLNRNK